jgi:hypothetical protein
MPKFNYQKIFITKLILIAIFLFFSHEAQAADFYVDPVNGSMTNDGSQAHPWSTMQAVIDACKIHTQAYKTPWSSTVPEQLLDKCPGGVVQSGDTIYLMSGYQGDLGIYAMVNQSTITVTAYPGQTPTFRKISLLGASNWRFSGITVNASLEDLSTWTATAIFNIENHANLGPCDHITIDNSTIYTINDSSVWTTLAQWKDNAKLGIRTQGEYTIIDNVTVKNAAGGVAAQSANHSVIRNCNFDMMTGDIIGVGNIYPEASGDLLIEYNRLTNIIPAWEEYGLHPDMMQFSSYAGSSTYPMINVTIRGNYVNSLELYGIHPLVANSNVQGINGFDGLCENFVIENNIIAVNSPHGTSWYGMKNSQIVNNTVIWPIDNISYAVGYIRVYNSKDGYISNGNIVRNNICTGVSVNGTPAIIDHNITAVVKNEHFINPESFDYRLKSTSLAINAGSVDLAPVIDIAKSNRDATPDIGAYEYNENIPSDTTPPTSPTNLSVE